MANCTIKKLAESVVNANLPVLEEPLAIIENVTSIPTSSGAITASLNVGDKSGIRVFFDGFDVSGLSINSGSTMNLQMYARDTEFAQGSGGSFQINGIDESNKATKFADFLSNGAHINGSITTYNTGQFRMFGSPSPAVWTYTGAPFKIVIFKEADS